MTKKINVYKNTVKSTYDLTPEKRAEYREISQKSRLAKMDAQAGRSISIHKINKPRLDPNELMPKKPRNKFTTLSLFSGGGGLDLGFDRAGFEHVASYELIPVCGETLLLNRPSWTVYSGPESGDVTKVEWKRYAGKVDVIHGGPPCQPFSIAGGQLGHADERNMWGEFNRAVNAIKPKAFVAENVLGLMGAKFDGFVKTQILDQLTDYYIIKFELNAANFGVPQIRRRVFFVGFRTKKAFDKFLIPTSTHSSVALKKSKMIADLFEGQMGKTMGVRKALGLKNIGIDSFAPTLRSGFTGKRNTTSILNSKAGQKSWGELEIWPNGVQASRQSASQFPAQDGHFRLSVEDCALLQGFPEDWKFAGAVYQILGQIGNSVCPPVAYAVAINVAKALKD
ncbi:DNA (cytosine-5-)-methyltransferase [Polynucleobacter sp.]|uniref:DNA cytosine methyltransferase n=1 Tax=Polynucleobacter sp. TaxID=2029855 RepID=UPI0025907A13|nr:DNA (cytosine-5-)-methyltransferase [Polynucleobacter sp.]MCX7237290.1 DNA (cytosine-5-)-methyltransferase [Polynucleobacter sp.]